jgi:hypothetical protein
MAFDLVMNAILAANTRLNGQVETLRPIGGQIVGNTNSFSQQVVNDSWRKMQNKLADLRYSGVQTDVLFSGVPPVANSDPATQVYFDFTGYWDGTANHGSFALPANLLQPYELTERPNGTTNIFTDLDPITWSLPRVTKADWNRQFLWRDNRLYMPGALVPTDISIVFAQLLSDFLDGSLPWFQQPVPILNCTDCLADYICREISIARGDAASAVAFQASAEDNAAMISNQDSTQGKSIVTNAQFQRMADSRTPNVGPDTSTVKR